ncbi:hypothetical protein QYM36_003556 [Artemia franciscana]|uniref:Uncharacterized protein n=1 Tax=Artemia franciscana TaxID=6661 RepID=A0AA88I478_ARTSF|nr:hypothetical protein QYM36_003556 [Artemia franciscana]
MKYNKTEFGDIGSSQISSGQGYSSANAELAKRGVLQEPDVIRSKVKLMNILCTILAHLKMCNLPQPILVSAPESKAYKEMEEESLRLQPYPKTKSIIQQRQEKRNLDFEDGMGELTGHHANGVQPEGGRRFSRNYLAGNFFGLRGKKSNFFGLRGKRRETVLD